MAAEARVARAMIVEEGRVKMDEKRGVRYRMTPRFGDVKPGRRRPVNVLKTLEEWEYLGGGLRESDSDRDRIGSPRRDGDRRSRTRSRTPEKMVEEEALAVIYDKPSPRGNSNTLRGHDPASVRVRDW